MPAEKQLTNKEMIDLLLHKAQEQQIGDLFRVKIMRRGSGAGYIPTAAQHVCTVKDAMVMHLANPETWIPQLLGGGSYTLTVYPGDNQTTPIGNDLTFVYQGAPPREIVDFDAPKRPDWAGPGEVIWPPRSKESGPPSLISLAPQATPQGAAPQTIVPGAGSSGGQFNGWIPPAGSSGGVSPEMLMLQQRERELAEREARIREEALRRETLLLTEKAKADLENERTRLKADMEAFRAQQIHAQATPKMSLAEIIAGVTAAIAPVVNLMMESQKTAREEAARRYEAQQAQQNKLFEMIVAKPAIDPNVQLVIDRLTPKDNTTSAEMLHSITDTMRNMTSMTMDALAAASEMGGPKQENMGLQIVRELARAVENFGSQGSRAIMAKVPPPAPHPVQVRPLPGSIAAPLPPPQPAGATAMGQQQPFNGVPPQAVQPANGNAQPAKPMEDPLVTLVRQGILPQHIVPQRMPNGDLSFASVPAALEYQIRLHEEPTKVVAFLRTHIEDAVLRHEFMQSGGVIELFERRLGPSWINADPANQPYIQNLMGMIQQTLVELGMIQGPQAEQEEEQPEDAQFAEEDPNAQGGEISP